MFPYRPSSGTVSTREMKMIRKIKALGLGLLAVLAISALGVSTASATFPLFHSEAEDTVLTGTQGQVMANVLTTDLGELKCQSVKYLGTQPGFTASTLTLKPKFETCQIEGVNSVVTENDCAFLFHLVIHTPECTIVVPQQAGRQTVTFTNEGEGATRGLIADLSVGGIHYEEHGAACATETETTEDGHYTGEITITGEDEEQEHIGIWVE
jgi:hypothetical protein